MTKDVPSRSMIQLHRFGDRVAASLPVGPTQYMTAGAAEIMAAGLLDVAQDIRTRAFTASECGTKHISPTLERDMAPAPKAMPAGLAYLNELPWIVRGEAEHENAPGAVWGLDPRQEGDYRPWPYFIRADVALEPGMIPLWIASEIQDLALADAIVADHNAALERRRASAPVTITPAQVAILRRLCEVGSRWHEVCSDLDASEEQTTERLASAEEDHDAALTDAYAVLEAIEAAGRTPEEQADHERRERERMRAEHEEALRREHFEG